MDWLSVYALKSLEIDWAPSCSSLGFLTTSFKVCEMAGIWATGGDVQPSAGGGTPGPCLVASATAW
eukprot:scaffold655213_cov42-Prasinocladus_malaysianus.AAC.2